jgi:hypothetical protein
MKLLQDGIARPKKITTMLTILQWMTIPAILGSQKEEWAKQNAHSSHPLRCKAIGDLKFH